MYKIGDTVKVTSFDYATDAYDTYYGTITDIKEVNANTVLFEVYFDYMNEWFCRPDIKNWFSAEEISKA